MKPSRLFVAALSTTTVLTGANAGGAAAAERFAKPGGSTAADCLTEATACALGKAIADTPTASQPNENVVTALPGDYTPADALAGDSSLLTGELRPKPGSILRGKPGSARPVFTGASPIDGDVAARVTQATIRHFTIRRTSAPGSRGVQMNGTPAMPATLDGVVVEADSGTLAVNADGASRVVNTLIDQKGGAGIGLGVSTFDGSPRIVNSSIFADGKALVVSYGYGYGASQVDLVNSLLHAPTDIVFSTVASNPSGSVTLATTASAYRPAVAPPGQFVTGSPVAFSDALISEAGAPLAGSTLIDAGISDPLSGSLDVAGKARVVGPAIDIGAFEFDPTAPTPTPAPTAAPAPTAVPVPTSVPTPVLAPVDVKKPSLTLEGSTKSLKRSKLAGKSGLELVAKVDEAATVGVELVVKSTKKGKTTERVLGSATTKTTAAGRAKLALKIKASKLGKGSLKATLRFTATDAAGNETLVERKTTVK